MLNTEICFICFILISWQRPRDHAGCIRFFFTGRWTFGKLPPGLRLYYPVPFTMNMVIWLNSGWWYTPGHFMNDPQKVSLREIIHASWIPSFCWLECRYNRTQRGLFQMLMWHIKCTHALDDCICFHRTNLSSYLSLNNDGLGCFTAHN